MHMPMGVRADYKFRYFSCLVLKDPEAIIDGKRSKLRAATQMK